MPKTLLTNQNIQISSPNPDIDWSRGDTFYFDTVQSETLTYSNAKNGQTILIIVNNTSVSTIVVTFPVSTLSKFDAFTGEIPAGSEGVFTLIKSDDKIYVTEVLEMQ